MPSSLSAGLLLLLLALVLFLLFHFITSGHSAGSCRCPPHSSLRSGDVSAISCAEPRQFHFSSMITRQISTHELCSIR
ncbi:uncharacterized protein BO87DRAFT_86226 [Aspergillus neoniger CBS 115656]|uniref:Secreted protein n=1 Tax=Aspergillus neoniger (strain CBS 115656) TaxID=1448310 RepID=A0A318Z9V7_ASPNB|nr:hypothetical protein BO87DRAFT_86226 [Aspergillus neoniger CBS 115656]PYH33292.1 hypothetical protein BO87DRAFT_86226 [Aspergillus neoniger CBS 115656]